MKACGIDLGTTNSCIYVVLSDGPALVIDDQKRPTLPSVVYLDKAGKETVGHAAKNRMGELPAPVATIKRRMGSTETVALGTLTESPVQISARILRHLRALASRQTGEEIDRAVVTVPAYFGHIQRQQTDEAARLAGFKEVTTLLEPVAAALAYTLSSDRERIRIFVYDLGGGTFDATVLEKDGEGGLNVLSFGGDPFLGGDDLDVRLTKLILEKLVASGYDLDLKLDQPEDFSRFQRLKFYAEDVKIRLTTEESVDLVRQGLFVDHSGDMVDLDVTVTRAELEERTGDLIERSIQESLATLSKKDIEISSVDEIIMVGGMSRMPLVARRLQEAFGRVPKLEDPDLIVARGAALKAGQIFPERAAGEGGLTLDLRYDKCTGRPVARVAGVLNGVVDGFAAYLIGAFGDRRESLSRTDRFVFDGVKLLPSQVNKFTLTIEDQSGEAVLEREIEIVQDPAATPVLASPGSVITKSIRLWTLDGPIDLFPENTGLPHFTKCELKTGDQSGTISLPIWEGNHEVERLALRGIPKDLPVGTPVVMEVSVEADYRIRAKAGVPSINRSIDITFQIAAVDTALLTPEHVAGRLRELEAKGKEVAAQCPSPQEVDIFWVRFRALRSAIEMEQTELEPKRLKIQENLGEISALICGISQRDAEIELHPTFEEFNERLSGIETHAIESRHSKLPVVRPQIEALRTEAEAAWKARDRFAWAHANSQVATIAAALKPEWSPTEWAMNLAHYIVVYQAEEIGSASGGGRFATQLAEIQREVVMIIAAMDTGRITPEDARSALEEILRKRIGPIRSALGLDAAEVPTGTAAQTGKGLVRT